MKDGTAAKMRGSADGCTAQTRNAGMLSVAGFGRVGGGGRIEDLDVIPGRTKSATGSWEKPRGGGLLALANV